MWCHWFCLISSAGASRRPTEPRFHLDLDRSEPWSSSSSSPRPSPFLSEASGFGSRSRSATPERRGSPLPDCSEPLGLTLEDDIGGVRQRPRGERVSDDLSGSPRRGIQKYLSRFDDAMKLRGQLPNEKPAQDGESDSEEFDAFRVFRLIGSILLAIFVRVFVCKYLVRHHVSVRFTLGSCYMLTTNQQCMIIREVLHITFYVIYFVVSIIMHLTTGDIMWPSYSFILVNICSISDSWTGLYGVVQILSKGKFALHMFYHFFSVVIDESCSTSFMYKM